MFQVPWTRSCLDGSRIQACCFRESLGGGNQETVLPLGIISVIGKSPPEGRCSLSSFNKYLLGTCVSHTVPNTHHNTKMLTLEELRFLHGVEKKGSITGQRLSSLDRPVGKAGLGWHLRTWISGQPSSGLERVRLNCLCEQYS